MFFPLARRIRVNYFNAFIMKTYLKLTSKLVLICLGLLMTSAMLQAQSTVKCDLADCPPECIELCKKICSPAGTAAVFASLLTPYFSEDKPSKVSCKPVDCSKEAKAVAGTETTENATAKMVSTEVKAAPSYGKAPEKAKLKANCAKKCSKAKASL